MTKEEINKAAEEIVESAEFYDYVPAKNKVIKSYTKEQIIAIFKKGVRFCLEDWLGEQTMKEAETGVIPPN
jgi:hypothetical protein